MSDKFNAFNQAKEEVKKEEKLKTKLPIKAKMVKQQKTIMLTPEQINKGKQLSEITGMSFSELVGYLIENAEWMSATTQLTIVTIITTLIITIVTTSAICY